MISTLCKHLGEGRAKRRRNRRSKRRHSSSRSHWADRTMSESEDEPECMDHSKLVIAPRGNDQEGAAKLADPFDLTSDQTAQIVPSQNEQTIQTYACDDEQTMDETTVEPDRKRRKFENLHRPVSLESSLDEFFSSLAASPSDPYEFSASDSSFDGKNFNTFIYSFIFNVFRQTQRFKSKWQLQKQPAARRVLLLTQLMGSGKLRIRIYLWVYEISHILLRGVGRGLLLGLIYVPPIEFSKQ